MNCTQVDIKSKEYKVATVLTYILSAMCAQIVQGVCLYMLVAKAEAGRTMPRARTMYLRVTSIKERCPRRRNIKRNIWST